MLIGGGHAHVAVLKAFGAAPEAGVRLTLVTKDLAATYSGMLPGFVAGHYALEDAQIDLVRLCQFAGARLIHGAATGIDRVGKRVLIDGHSSIAYGLLSIDVGITPFLGEIAGAPEHAIAVKPISAFAEKWLALERRALQPGGPRNVVVIGGGAAGVELVLAALHKLRLGAPTADIDPDAFSFTLIAGGRVLAGTNPWARSLARRVLANVGVTVIEDDVAVRIVPPFVTLASGRKVTADGVLVSTKAAAPPWFATTDLPRHTDGFLAVRPTLQILDDDDVFAVGDCATIVQYPRPKAGVFAVRQGPIVADNLRRRVRGGTVRPYIPQGRILTLISLGDKRAIAARGPLAAMGGWAWTWKDRIDRAFVDAYNHLPIKSAG